MGIQCWSDLVKFGAREHLQAEYEGLLLGEGETEPEYDVSLRIDLEQIPAGPGASLQLEQAFNYGRLAPYWVLQQKLDSHLPDSRLSVVQTQHHLHLQTDYHTPPSVSAPNLS